MTSRLISSTRFLASNVADNDPGLDAMNERGCSLNGSNCFKDEEVSYEVYQGGSPILM